MPFVNAEGMLISASAFPVKAQSFSHRSSRSARLSPTLVMVASDTLPQKLCNRRILIHRTWWHNTKLRFVSPPSGGLIATRCGMFRSVPVLLLPSLCVILQFRIILVKSIDAGVARFDRVVRIALPTLRVLNHRYLSRP